MHREDLRRTDLNLLVALEALLQEGSVTLAARRVGLSQPAMSRALGRLRESFDDPLFVPSGRRLVPTARAQELADALPPILDEVRGLFAPPAFDPATAKLHFRINAPDATTMLILRDFVAGAMQDAPEMDFTISNDAGSQLDALEAGEIDLAVDSFIDAPDTFYRQSLLQDHLVCVVRRGHPAAGSGFDTDAFVRWPHVWVDTATSRALDRFLLSAKAAPRRALRLANFLTAASVVAKTDALLVLPSLVAARAGEIEDLAILPLPVEMPVLSLDQLWHARRHHDPAHTWLRQSIERTAKSVRRSLNGDRS